VLSLSTPASLPRDGAGGRRWVSDEMLERCWTKGI
jgi:hypothetical protein